MFLVWSELSLTAYLFLVFYRSTSLQSLLFLEYIGTFLWKSKSVNNCSIPSKQLRITIVFQKYWDLLQPQSCDRFSKILRTFYASKKSWIIVVFLQRTPKEKLPIFLINTLLLYIPLLALTDRQNQRQRNEYTCYAWAGGTFFQLCCCVSFLVVAEIILGNTYLQYQLCHCVFFLLRQEIVFGCTGCFFGCGGKGFRCYFLTYHTSCAIVSVFWLRREIVFGYSVSRKHSNSVSLIERQTASKCVYFIRSNTLLLCVSLLSIYLLYQKDR